MSQEPVLTHHRITVLLVDDQKMVGEAVRRMLTGEKDIDFHYCQDPTLAIRTANRISPTVILQDLVMPEIEGLRLVRYFRANPGTRDVPLIVLSSEEEPETKAEAFALGANDYLVKLPDRLELLARIRYHSRGYINLLERDEAYNALLESRKQLEIRNAFIKKTFGRYLSDDVVESILDSPEGTRLGGEKRRVTIMMTDLRGFTAISERLPAEHVVGIINIYLEIMTEIILKYQGTIDEFIGDAILVIFGAPVLREDDARRAAACAIEMQLAMETVNARNREAGYPDVAQGIGINTGDLVVGNIGSEKRSKYGVVGRNVNLTSRIESYTVGGQILISESTLAACGDALRIDDQFEVMPKGLKHPITIYELGGIGGSATLCLPEKHTAELKSLAVPLPVRFTVLEGKDGGGEIRRGRMQSLQTDMAEIHSEAEVPWMANIRVFLSDASDNPVTDDLYAKVTKIVSEAPFVFRVSFTSASPEAEAFLRSVLRAA
ncbi:adenylate and Guanylate cyclase catalytic domain protein [Desulfonema ishimotonii]|uniref:Adenylate and Guanylate cyclase catalytic domain protein n=1 Tax=Desulfonema ishimotonii TaxID=45657 RepID=A0A401G2D0_9BACT|nr:adenylate/guanylate cyclase domain-containing protein [Desulfonema ishimotonii]GBC63398.1 adenylate and Guanylate cyclase catalytic domain protein [Desulfonema ishimotonii]